MPDPNTAKVVGGHFLGISIGSLFAGRQIKRSILLRDSASHFVSYYNYRMARYISEGLQPYSLEVAYGATQRNFITHYILSNFLELSWARIASLSDAEKYELANAFLATFWFVGDYRFRNDFIVGLSDRLGISPSATPRNVLADMAQGIGWRPITLDRLSSRMIPDIRAENALDQRLWETCREARHDTSAVRPIPLEARSSSFIGNEANRLVNQILQRVHRRWGSFDPAPVPVLHGDRATPA